MDGTVDGSNVGATEGCQVGEIVGCLLELREGSIEGFAEGATPVEGTRVGTIFAVGLVVGAVVDFAVGTIDGLLVGAMGELITNGSARITKNKTTT